MTRTGTAAAGTHALAPRAQGRGTRARRWMVVALTCAGAFAAAWMVRAWRSDAVEAPGATSAARAASPRPRGADTTPSVMSTGAARAEKPSTATETLDTPSAEPISGEVVDDNGARIAGASVALVRGAAALALPAHDDAGGDAPAPPLAGTTSGSDGSFEISASDAATPVDLVVTAVGHDLGVVRRVFPGGHYVVQLQSVPGGICGRAIDAGTRAPVAGAWVSCRRNEDGTLHRVVTDARGEYCVRDLPPGSYLVVAASASHAPARRALHVGGGLLDGVDLELTACATIEIEVRDAESGAPLAGVRVDDGAFVATTDERGRARVAGPVNAIQAVAVALSKPDYVRRAATFAPGALDYSAALQRERAYGALVALPSGVAPGDVIATFEQRCGTERTVRTAVCREHAPALALASAVGFAAGAPVTVHISGPRSERGTGAAGPLEHGDAQSLPVVALEPGFSVSGVVVDAARGPIAGALVAADPIASPALAQGARVTVERLSALRHVCATDARGRFQLAGLPAEACTLRVLRAGFELEALRIEPPARGDALDGLEIGMSPLPGAPGDIRGVLAVESAAARPANAIVIAVDARGERWYASAGDGGEFALRDLPPGEYELLATIAADGELRCESLGTPVRPGDGPITFVMRLR